MANFVAGDTVRLKSGGPLMTVNAVEDDDVHASWFDDKSVLKHSTFKESVLEKSDNNIIFG